MRYGEGKNPIVFSGGQRSSGVTRGQTLQTSLTWYLKVGSLGKFYSHYVDAIWLEEGPYHFWQRSKVIWGHQGSNSENLVNTISQARKLGSSSYLICRCVMIGRRTLSFFVEVKGHLGSLRVKPWKPFEHNILKCMDRFHTWGVNAS